MREVIAAAEDLVGEVRAAHAPDPRLAVFEVSVEVEDGVLVLSGATSEIEAAEDLHRRIASLSAFRSVVDRVVRLPEGVADESVHGVVTAAVAPMLAGPRIAETQVSQVVMGNRVLVLRNKGRWLQCRSPDGYIGWVHAGYVMLVDESHARAWEMGSGGDVWISLGAELRGERDEVVARLPWGARVLRQSDGMVRLPDGLRGRPEGELLPSALRPLGFPATGEAIVETAARWMGVPYLWGGLTMGGVDCSGLVQAVFRMHGVPLPRDSDQQSRSGIPIDPGDGFCDLLPGDLLFYAEEPGRCTHVTISMGGPRIIHSSLGNGGVGMNDLTGRRAYERELTRIWFAARRVL